MFKKTKSICCWLVLKNFLKSNFCHLFGKYLNFVHFDLDGAKVDNEFQACGVDLNLLVC